jgi:hypothetical protein
MFSPLMLLTKPIDNEELLAKIDLLVVLDGAKTEREKMKKIEELKAMKKETYPFYTLEEVQQEYPEGTYCTKCNKLNDLWDDCGWYYAPTGAVCKECFKALGLTTCER